jgi:hypothetical protein
MTSGGEKREREKVGKMLSTLGMGKNKRQPFPPMAKY